MVTTVKSCTLVGIDAELVDVECTIDRGLPQYSVVGLAAPSVKEGATRIQNALKTVGYDLPLKKVTINLAPADLRKPGSGLDLPIALAVLIAEGAIAPGALAGLLVLGELGLDGTVRSVRGVLASAMLARATGLRGISIPHHCADEAEVVDGIAVHVVRHLGEIIAVFQPVPLHELRAIQSGEPSAAIRARVACARDRQLTRLRPWNLRCNAEMPSAGQRATCKLDSLGERTLADLVEKRHSFTARSIDRLIKVARTIADLIGQDDIDAGCLLEAAAYRDVDPTADFVPHVA